MFNFFDESLQLNSLRTLAVWDVILFNWQINHINLMKYIGPNIIPSAQTMSPYEYIRLFLITLYEVVERDNVVDSACFTRTSSRIAVS